MDPTRKRKRAKGPDAVTDSPYFHGKDNAKRVLVCYRAAAVIATEDHHDGAHRVRVGAFLVSAASQAAFAKPRLYPLSSMAICRFTDRLVAHDSIYDGWHECVKRLEAAGITVTARRTTQQEVVAEAASMCGAHPRIRDVLEKRTRQVVSRRERELEREGTRILREAEAKA